MSKIKEITYWLIEINTDLNGTFWASCDCDKEKAWVKDTNNAARFPTYSAAARVMNCLFVDASYLRELHITEHSDVPELRALLAERDALREQRANANVYIEALISSTDFNERLVGTTLKSLLNATLSGGERTIADEQAEYDQYYQEWLNYPARADDSAASFLDYLKLRCCVRTLDNTVKGERG